MSGASSTPVLIPSTFTVGKEQLVIVEFPWEIPQDAGLITFNFYHSGKKLSTVPAAPLGPRALKAKFPEFSIYGEVETVVHINREERGVIPRFRFQVQSQLEAVFGAGVTSPGIKRIALLASVIAYLTHCDEKNREISAQADPLLCEILQQLHTFELNDWTLQPLLTGKRGNEENLLHFCARRGLGETAGHLLLGVTHSKKSDYLTQRGSDNKTPVDLARKNDMRHFVGIAEQIMQGSSVNKKRSNAKRKSRMVEKSTSIDSDMSHLCVPGSPDANSLTQSLSHSSEQHKPRKEGKGAKLWRPFRKDKGVIVSQPQQPFINEYGEPKLAPSPTHTSPTLPVSRSMEPIPSSWSEHSSDPFSENNYHLASYYSTSTPPPTSPLLAVKHDRSAVTFPRNVRPTSHAESGESSSPSFDQGDSRLLSSGRPVSSSLSATSDYGSAMSNAIRELKTNALYVAEVVREFTWQVEGDSVLKVGDQVLVTQEAVEGDCQMCMGVWNGHYGKLPLSVLKRLPQAELDRLRDEGESSGDDYERVDDSLWAGDEEDVYKVPRNVPTSPYLAGSDSEGEQPVYDVPPSRLKAAGPQIKEAESDDDQPVYDVPPNRLKVASSQIQEAEPDDVYDVPPSRLKVASPQPEGAESDDDPVYDVPPSRERSITPDIDMHDYQNIKHGMFPISSLAAQLFSQNPDLATPKTEADGHNTGSSSAPQLSSLNDRDSSGHKSGSRSVAQRPSAYENSMIQADKDLSSIHHDADLEEMSALMDQVQQEATSLLHTSTAWPSSTDTQTSVAAHKHPQPVSKSSSFHTHSENRVVQKVTDIDASNTHIAYSPKPEVNGHTHTTYSPKPEVNGHTHTAYSPKPEVNEHTHTAYSPKPEVNKHTHTAYSPKPEVNGPALGKSSSPKGRRYGNTLTEDGEAMAVGRGHTQEAAGDNEVFKKQPASPTPTPRKRNRLPTDPPPKTSPKLAPKPKPTSRRKTNPVKSESDEPTSKIEEILASSTIKGEVRISPGTSHRPPPSHQHNGTAQMCRNLEVREAVKSRTLPPPSTRTYGSHFTSSPGTAKKPTPPVAPKPAHKKK